MIFVYVLLIDYKVIYQYINTYIYIYKIFNTNNIDFYIVIILSLPIDIFIYTR
jgi:hypothetical protein